MRAQDSGGLYVACVKYFDGREGRDFGLVYYWKDHSGSVAGIFRWTDLGDYEEHRPMVFQDGSLF